MSGDIFDIINPTNTLGVSRPLAHVIGAYETIVYGALLAKYSYYKKNNMLDDGWFYSIERYCNKFSQLESGREIERFLPRQL